MQVTDRAEFDGRSLAVETVTADMAFSPSGRNTVQRLLGIRNRIVARRGFPIRYGLRFSHVWLRRERPIALSARLSTIRWPSQFPQCKNSFRIIAALMGFDYAATRPGSATIPGMPDKAPVRSVWTGCHICLFSFDRKRTTSLYCSKCGKGYCDSEHGSMDATGVGMCLFCRDPIGPPGHAARDSAG